MKAAISITRIIVGILFIFSGLVKANDPLGLAYKMHEFFEVWGWPQSYAEVPAFSFQTLFAFIIKSIEVWFVKHELLLSVLMNAFEIIAGFALLLGWRIRLFSWLLLLLILFFTFLTGYTYITGQPANCGCFGDCIPISSKTSFLKDVVLTVLIGFIFWNRHRIKPLFSNKANTLAMLAVTIFSFGLQWYSLNYLPIVDCLPFRKNNNIPEQMKIPANAIPDSTVITFVYEKDGKQLEFTADKFPADFNSSYKFISRYDKVVRKGKNNVAPIHGFNLYGADANTDSAAFILSQPYALLLFVEDLSTPFSKWNASFSKIHTAARLKNIPVYAITSVRDTLVKTFAGTSFSTVPVLISDYTAIRTAARTNPCLYLLSNGTVKGKWSYKRMENVLEYINGIAAQKPVTPPVIEVTDTLLNTQPAPAQHP